MGLRRLQTFVIVAELGTVSKAASRSRISQPALSRRIGGLEEEFDLKLFDRIGRRLVLTAAGEQLLADCRGDYTANCAEASGLDHGKPVRILAVRTFIARAPAARTGALVEAVAWWGCLCTFRHRRGRAVVGVIKRGMSCKSRPPTQESVFWRL
jgi:hypothetical protein